MPRLQLRRLHRLNQLQRRERSEIAVEVPAGRHRINVRSEQDRRLIRLAAEARENVSRRVDARHDVRGFDLVDDPRARRQVRHRIRDAIDAVGERATGRTTVIAQSLEAITQPGGVDGR